MSEPFIEPPLEDWWASGPIVHTWDDLRFPAQDLSVLGWAGNTNPPDADNQENSFPGTLLFRFNQDNMCAGMVQLPHDTKIDILAPHIHWMKTTSASGAVVWEFTYRIIGNPGDISLPWSSADNGTLVVNHGDTANKHAITSFNTLSLVGLHVSAMLAFRIYRRGDDVGDTYGTDARLLEFDFHYQKVAGKRGTLLRRPEVN